MSRFNVRLIGSATAPPPSIITDKKPSAYSAMKHGGSAAPVSAFVPMEGEPKSKGGRPSKDDVRRHKMTMASNLISVLVLSKPTRAKIRDYVQSRITQLDEEKR